MPGVRKLVRQGRRGAPNWDGLLGGQRGKSASASPLVVCFPCRGMRDSIKWGAGERNRPLWLVEGCLRLQTGPRSSSMLLVSRQQLQHLRLPPNIPSRHPRGGRWGRGIQQWAKEDVSEEGHCSLDGFLLVCRAFVCQGANRSQEGCGERCKLLRR